MLFAVSVVLAALVDASKGRAPTNLQLEELGKMSEQLQSWLWRWLGERGIPYLTDPELAQLARDVSTAFHGFEFVGLGSSRIVVAVPSMGTVLKVDLSANPRARGWPGGNLEELQLWERAQGTKLERHLAPILAADPGGRWLVQERVRTWPPDAVGNPDLSLSSWVTSEVLIAAAAAEAGVRLSDNVPRNIGRTEAGDFVALDYSAWRSSEKGIVTPGVYERLLEDVQGE